MKYCEKCVMPDTRPRIEFDENGVCNACNYMEKRKKMTKKQWKDRHKQFMKICDRFRKKDGWDCIVPCSGGKDSSRIAIELKEKYRMHPLLVTFAPVMYTKHGARNIENLRKNGFDNIILYPNRKVMAKLSRGMFEKFGDPFIPWVTGVYSLPLRMATMLGIPLVVYAEQGEAFFGGSTKVSDKKVDKKVIDVAAKTGDVKNWKKPENWAKMFGLSRNDIEPYILPKNSEMKNLNPVYYAYYHEWHVESNYMFVKKKIGFCEAGKRMLGTYQNYSSIDDMIDGLYMFIMYCKFGFSRATKDACKEIRDGTMTRKLGMDLARKYDGEFPYTKTELKEILGYLGMTEKHMWKTIRKFINPDVWKKKGKHYVCRFDSRKVLKVR